MSRRRVPPPLADKVAVSPVYSTTQENASISSIPPPPLHPLSTRLVPVQGALNQSVYATSSASDSIRDDASLHSEDVRAELASPMTSPSDAAGSSPRANRMQIPGIVVDFDADSPPLSPTIEETIEEEMSEKELRALYDEEEMNRFLNMFSAYVREVRAVNPTTSTLDPSFNEGSDPLRPSEPAEKRVLETMDVDDEGWTSLDDSQRTPITAPTPSSEESLSKRIAMLLLPYLPPPKAPPPRFSLGRMREVAQRLFLAIEPTYRPFLLRMLRLAAWHDWSTSCFWCSVYWVLWSQNLLLPGLMLRILWSLIRRRLYPYPTLAQLRERRKEIAKAEEFGEGLSSRLTKTSKFGVRDAWKIFQDFRSTSDMNLGPEHPEVLSAEDSVFEIPTVEALLEDTPSEQTLLMLVLVMLNAVADLHERVRNVFLWRRPASSWKYGTIIFAISLGTLVTPAQYLAKMVYFGAGFAFWHVAPVLVYIPASGRTRLPPLLGDVPTDTDYAMLLMAERVAKGHDLKPTKQSRKPRRSGAKKNGQSVDAFRSGQPSTDTLENAEGETTTRRAKWIKNAVTAAQTSKVIAQEGYSIAKQIRAKVRSGSLDLDSPQSLEQPEETFSFLAQHSSGPGLLSLSASSLSFALATGSKKFTILRSAIRGVKKTNALGVKGLAIRWMDDGSHECTEKFHWLKNRDEAFARLLAGGERQWL